MRRKPTGWKAVAFSGALLVLPADAAAARKFQEEGIPEYKVKAAFLVNFVRYAEWPEKAFTDAGEALVVAVLGKDPFGDHLGEAFKDRKAGTRAIRIVRCSRLADLGRVHLLFVAASEKEQWAALLKTMKDKPVLVVGDTEGFAKAGAAINLYLEEGKVRFEINPEAATRHGITLSSKLLKLARIVRDDGSGGNR